MDKTVLIIGANSELAQETIKELKKRNFKIYTTSRQVEMMDKNVHEFYLDVVSEPDFKYLKEKIKNLSFDSVVNFAGIAVAGPIEQINEKDFKKQLDVNTFGLLKIMKYICPSLKKSGKLVNISSMAAYGVFPLLAPYSISKASADILLNTFSIETGIKTVSIRPGAVATKFWDSSVELNKKILEENSETFNQEDKYIKEKKFLLNNAKRNSLRATSPIYTAKKIADIIEKKNPKTIYNIGFDSKVAKLSRFLPQGLINSLIKTVLKTRVLKTS